MGRTRNKILSSIIRPRKAEQERQAKEAASTAKKQKEVERAVLGAKAAFGDTPEYAAAAANAQRANQMRTIKRARMCSVDKPFISTSGWCTVLIPNTSYPAAAQVYEDVDGTQKATWRLGDGGSAELMLMGVDPQSISNWLESFRSSYIRCVIPGHPVDGPPIYASAHVIQRTTESGRALQPIHEAVKAIANAAPSFVGPLGQVSGMGELIQGATGFVRDTSVTAVSSRNTDRKAPADATLQKARTLVAQKVTDDEFRLADVNVTVGIVFSIAGNPNEEIGKGLWSLANNQTPAFQRVMKELRSKWSGA